MNKIITQKLNENPFRPLVDIVYEILLNEIINFNYLPGTKIIESKIAEELGVSRTPVRDAISILEKEGFIQKSAKATIVAPFDANDYFDLNNFRYVLEPLAAGYAAQRISDNELEQLYNYAQKIESAYKSGEYKEMFKAENEFHEFIILCSKNKYLIEAYQNIHPQMKRYRVYITADASLYDFLCDEHYFIYNSIKLKNKEVAEAALRRHISLLTTKSADEIYNDNRKIIKKKLEVMNNLAQK
ncbi:MAG: GntR family transcriptional regulator [Eubacteriaceae bacterium]|nr:GntR family transcriptional regulator [Eubacteriaceae bacterium]